MVPHMHDDAGASVVASAIPDPFLIDEEVLFRRGRCAQSRVRWRSAILAVTRKMLAEDGYRAFSLRRLAVLGHTSSQNIYNNLGAKDDIILQALLNYNQALLTREHDEPCHGNAYVRLVAARHQTTTVYPAYARAIHETLFNNPELSKAMMTKTIHLIAPYVKSVLRAYGVASIDPMQISRLLAAVARNAARDWTHGACSADDMLRNSIADGELCLLGALLKSQIRAGRQNLGDLGFSHPYVRH